MQRARSPHDLAARPIDRYWLGDHQLVWCSSVGAAGSLHWGEPTDADARALTDALGLAVHPGLAGGIDVLIDCSAVQSVPWSAFEIVLGYARAHVPAWSHRIKRQVVIVGDGPTGAQLVGMAPLIGETFPMRVARDRDDGLSWLDWPDTTRTILDEVTRIVATARCTRSIVHRLSVWLTTQVATATIEAAAKALGRSTRTLQRELQHAGTSFRAELAAARVRVAASRLATSEDKIEVIAREVGYTTSSRLATTFRRREGVTPSRYRELSAASASRATNLEPTRTRRA